MSEPVKMVGSTGFFLKMIGFFVSSIKKLAQTPLWQKLQALGRDIHFR